MDDGFCLLLTCMLRSMPKSESRLVTKFLRGSLDFPIEINIFFLVQIYAQSRQRARLLLQSSELAPLTPRRCVLPPLVPEGGHTRLRERGLGGPNSDEGTDTLVLQVCTLWEMLDNVSVVHVIFSVLLFVKRVWYISAGTGPCFPLSGRFCRRYVNVRENLLPRCHSLTCSKPNNFYLWLMVLNLWLVMGVQK
jgi:hypothetical protein